MLKQLPYGALQPLTQLLTEMERTGRSPGQWRVVKFAMLAKKADIERPIGLCDVVYKAVFPYPSIVCSKLSLPKLITNAG